MAKLKFNWGTGIAIFYSCFMIAMVSMVIKSTYHKAHLVQEDYYHKDLNYEDFRQKRLNASKMPQPLQIRLDAQSNAVQVVFPKEMANATGNVTLFRPSNKFLDRTIPIALDEMGQMRIPLEKNTLSGRWKVKVDWKSNGQTYYKEESLVL